tara:strand:+ start:5609 stop:6517 length:909 start_codon:yes stop_codon:yes gene_type:complete
MEIERFRHHLTGPVASINTPFLKDGQIDFDGLNRFVDFTIESGVGALLFTPGDSLYEMLTAEEVGELTSFTSSIVNKRALFIASAGFWSTKQTVEFAEYASKCGADAVIVAPPDRGMTVDNLVQYYQLVSANLPAFILSAGLVSVGVQGALETVDRLLTEAPGILGFKEDYSSDFARAACAKASEKWVIFAGGQKQTHMDMLPYGCDGYMSTFVKFNPSISNLYWEAIKMGDIKSAAEVIAQYDIPFFQYVYNSFPAGGDAGQHAILELAGICGRWRRDPLPDFSDQDMEQLKAFLNTNNML